MINHHPSSDLLSTYANGGLATGMALAVDAHVEVCRVCRKELAILEGLGGVLLTRATPESLSEGALDRVLSLIDDEPMRVHTPPDLPGFLARFHIPKGVRRHPIAARRWLAPGIWFAPVDTGVKAEACTFLVYGAANSILPQHTHADREFTIVLDGAYSDELGRFAAGDFAEADSVTLHAPNVTEDAECLCLISSDGPMKFEGFVARLIQTFAGHRY